ncbi:DUF4249 family protein [Pricia sp.]|uniref:DUF4249 family protein n=1 Tax=Pricia sp. TaxID=2268138 RepID=UPI003594288C
MKNYIFPVLTIILVVFLGCTKTVDADNLLDTEEKVLIVGFISPNDTVLRINVTKALPVIGTPLPNSNLEALQSKFRISDAVVTLSDEAGNSTVLDFSDDNQAYLADPDSLPVITGATYLLNVSVNGKEFNASCQIPEKIGEIAHQVVYRNDEFGSRIAEISLAFTDFDNERNFYMLGGTYSTIFTFEDGEPHTVEGLLFYDANRFLTDNIEDGGTLSGQSEIFIGNEVEVDSGSVILKVAHVEEILFQQMRTSDLNIEAGDGNPFVEYSISPNNILDEGAVGVFAGYQVTEKEVVLEVPEN